MTWPTPPFLYAPSPLVAGASAAGAVVMAFLAISEFCGDNLTYSKFWGPAGGGGRRPAALLVSSRLGMLLLYAPALVAALASFAVPGAVVGARAHLLSAAIAVHFLKRVLEVIRQKTTKIDPRLYMNFIDQHGSIILV